MTTPLHRTLRSSLVRRVVEMAKKRGLFEHGDRILVAVSGGPDSVALLSVLAVLAPSWNLTLCAVHFDYGLRGQESDDDARFVADLCGRMKVELICQRIDLGGGAPIRMPLNRDVDAAIRSPSEPGKNLGGSNGPHGYQKVGSLQEAAREARYQAMLRIGAAFRATKIAVGHTADDQAETFVMWMLRGAGLTGLSGIPPMRKSLFIRPLLEISRADILVYLEDEGLPFRTDSSNAKPIYMRNRIRHDLLPALRRFNPSLVKVLERQADILREDDACLDQMAAEQIRRLAHADPNGEYVVDRSGLVALPVALQRRIIRALVQRIAGLMKGPGFATVEAVLHRVAHGRSGSSLVVQGGRVSREYDLLRLCSAHRVGSVFSIHDAADELPLPVPSIQPWPLTGQFIQTSLVQSVPSDLPDERHRMRTAVLCDADRMTMNLTARCWKPGDFFQPLGMSGRQKKLQDYFTNIKLPRRERLRVPLIVAPEGIVWVAGHRMDHRFRTTSRTRQILMLTLTDLSDRQEIH